MIAPIQPGHAIDAFQPPRQTARGTRFQQEKDQVARIERPLSPALVQARDPNAVTRPAAMEKSQNGVYRLMNRMRHTHDISLAPLVAQQMQELDYQATVVAKTVGKVGSSLKEIVTAA